MLGLLLDVLQPDPLDTQSSVSAQNQLNWTRNTKTTGVPLLVHCWFYHPVAAPKIQNAPSRTAFVSQDSGKHLSGLYALYTFSSAFSIGISPKEEKVGSMCLSQVSPEKGTPIFGELEIGVGQNLTTRNRTAGFSPWFHLPGFHLGYPFLTHSHIGTSSLPRKASRQLRALGSTGTPAARSARRRACPGWTSSSEGSRRSPRSLKGSPRTTGPPAPRSWRRGDPTWRAARSVEKNWNPLWGGILQEGQGCY